MLRFIRPVQRVLITHPIRQKSRVLPTLVAGVGLTATYLAYQSQYPVYLDSPSTVTDPASNVSFPVYLSTDHKRLIGLGVRTVSFLKMHVYIIGMYMRSEDLGELKKVKGWEHFDKQEFLENRELADRLLDQPYDISIRIVSARNTNTQHLRDGFVRLLLQRMKDQKMTEEEERDVLKGIQEFKSNFPSMRVEKHTVFVFTKTSNGELDMAYEGKHLGTVPNKWISKNFVMSYLEPKAPSSEAALHDIANGFETLLK